MPECRIGNHARLAVKTAALRSTNSRPVAAAPQSSEPVWARRWSISAPVQTAIRSESFRPTNPFSRPTRQGNSLVARFRFGETPVVSQEGDASEPVQERADFSSSDIPTRPTTRPICRTATPNFRSRSRWSLGTFSSSRFTPRPVRGRDGGWMSSPINRGEVGQSFKIFTQRRLSKVAEGSWHGTL